MGERDAYSSSVTRELIGQALDDGYTLAAAGNGDREPVRSSKWRVGAVAALIVLGLMLTVAAVQTKRSAPAVAKEKAELVERINDQTQVLQRLRARADELEHTVTRLQNSVLTRTTSGQDIQERLDALGVLAGTTKVKGPGMRIVVDDAPTGGVEDDDSNGRVLDLDLQQTVNGLWRAGAEAIAINGVRLSSVTPIRGADKAITVDYRPLSTPYVIEAIGNPDTLQSRFAEGPGGDWLSSLHSEESIPLEITTVDSLELPADTGIHIRYATTEGSQ